jgi:hypothetical protein
MAEANGGNLTEKERAYLEHLEQAQKQGVSFAQYCRQQGLPINPWYWVRSRLVRKGVISGREKAKGRKSVGFAAVHVAPTAPTVPTACRISHPSGWLIECEGLPQVQWLTALLSGAKA